MDKAKKISRNERTFLQEGQPGGFEQMITEQDRLGSGKPSTNRYRSACSLVLPRSVTLQWKLKKKHHNVETPGQAQRRKVNQ